MTNPRENNVFYSAVRYATVAHQNQRRDCSTDPYIVHPMRVAYLALDAGLDMDVAAAAVMHDVVEDTDVPMYLLEQEFPGKIALIVDLLTKWWTNDIPEEEKAYNKHLYYSRILGNQDAINVKLLDRVDNLRDMMLLLPKKTRWVQKYVRKTEEEIEQLYAASNNPTIQTLYRGTLSALKKKLEEQNASTKNL